MLDSNPKLLNKRSTGFSDDSISVASSSRISKLSNVTKTESNKHYLDPKKNSDDNKNKKTSRIDSERVDLIGYDDDSFLSSSSPYNTNRNEKSKNN